MPTRTQNTLDIAQDSENNNALNIVQDVDSDLHQELSKIKCEPLMSKAQQRKIAKAGLVASMGILTVTGFASMRGHSKHAHTLAGFALLGFSLWHTSLYKSPKVKPVKENQ